MLTKLHTIFLILVVSVALNSCFKKENYPIEPVVAFDTFIVDANTGKAQIVFEFTDGDGDIGLLESDTLAPYDKAGSNYFNFFLTYYEKDDSLGWVIGKNIDGEDIILPFRLKPVMDYSITKGIKGTITYDFDFYYNPLSSQSDTIKYDFQVIDRALNASNIGETDYILTP
ncbi:MAG: hypothetical protein R3279_02445 [Putridiphycobacter sp.]|jgi:hypothetical protein|nr:hypothetical protein [Putridiphycobacter sp.]